MFSTLYANLVISISSTLHTLDPKLKTKIILPGTKGFRQVKVMIYKSSGLMVGQGNTCIFILQIPAQPAKTISQMCLVEEILKFHNSLLRRKN